jgi:hypothetical protein
VKFVQNKHSAPVSPPPVRGFPSIVFGVGVTPIDESHLVALREHPSMAHFWKSCLTVVEADWTIEEPKLTEEPKSTEEPKGKAKLPPLKSKEDPK